MYNNYSSNKSDKRICNFKEEQGIVNIQDDSYCESEGCPTCGYGACYITDIIFELTTCKYHVEYEGSYSDDKLSQGIVMKSLFSIYDKLKEIDESEFGDLFVDTLYIVAKKRVYGYYTYD